MLKSNQREKITIVVDKVLASWIKKEATNQNRSINNFIETILLQKKKETEKVMECLSVQ